MGIEMRSLARRRNVVLWAGLALCLMLLSCGMIASAGNDGKSPSPSPSPSDEDDEMKGTVDVSLPNFQDVENLLGYSDYTFVAKSGYESYDWWFDSVKTAVSGESYVLQTTDMDDGYHSLMLVVTDRDGEKYSVSADICVRRQA